MELDLRNMQCPKPLMETKKKLKEIKVGQTFTVILNDKTPFDNIIQYLKSAGIEHEGINERVQYFVKVKKNKEVVMSQPPVKRLTSVIVSSECMGCGSEELGKVLMQGFINTLPDLDVLPNKVVFYNSGVKLLGKDSPVLKALNKLADKGVIIKGCGTCIDFYGIKDKLAVGKITNMYNIITIMQDTHVMKP